MLLKFYYICSQNCSVAQVLKDYLPYSIEPLEKKFESTVYFPETNLTVGIGTVYVFWTYACLSSGDY